MCVLMLRGPQTPRRITRPHGAALLVRRSGRRGEHATSPGGHGFCQMLPRQTGYKEQRWTHLLSGDVEIVQDVAPAQERSSSGSERIAALEQEVAELRRQFEDFRRRFE